MSFTFNTLPFKGYTPYNLRCSCDNPDNAIAFAESPSVRMRMHLEDWGVPAYTASSSFGIPVILDCFFPSVLDASFAFFSDANVSKCSTIPNLDTIFFRVSSDNFGELPKADTFVVNVSLVCDVKLGFSTIPTTKTASCSFTAEFATFAFFFVSI